MIKHFLSEFFHRLKGQALDVVVSTFLEALAAHRRASRDGHFDLHRQGNSAPMPPYSSQRQEQPRKTVL